jgi:formylglycine-generating enzyme required for sulfatase activity
MPDPRESTLDSLEAFCKGLKDRCAFVEQKYPGMPEYFRYLVGPWLSQELLPHPSTSNACRFLLGYQNHKNEFIQRIVTPLIGANLFGADFVRSASGSLLDRVQVFSPPNARLLSGLELRLATIQLVHNRSDTVTLQSGLAALIRAYQSFFGTDRWSSAAPYELEEYRKNRTSAWLALKRFDQDLALSIEDVVRQNQWDAKGKSVAWSFLDPAIAFLTDSMCEILGGTPGVRSFASEQATSDHWHPGETWAMIVLKHPGTQLTTPKRVGMVYRLRIEAIRHDQEGFTQADIISPIYPHPHLGLHFPIDRTFQSAIRNAWMTVCAHRLKDGKPPRHDFRWSLVPYDESDGESNLIEATSVDTRDTKLPNIVQTKRIWEQVSQEGKRHRCLWSPLAGPSATFAFALALESAVQQQRLRRDVAATGQFHVQDFDCNTLTRDPSTGKEILGVFPKLMAAEDVGVERLLVSDSQTSDLPLVKDQWTKCATFLELYRQASEIEGVVNRIVAQASSFWTTVENWTGKTEIDSKDYEDEKILQQEHRFDLYVPPEYAWQDPNPKFALERSGKEPRWLSDPLGGDPNDQLHRALQWAYQHHQNIVLVDTAGAGKTISAFKIQQVLSSEHSCRQVFEDTPPHAVLLWSSKLPETNKTHPTLRDLLRADPSIQVACEGSQITPDALVSYLLESKRLVVVVDAYDELSESKESDQKKILQSVYQEKDSKAIFWIVTGREYAIEQSSETGNLFATGFRRLQIESFSEELQNRYMNGFLATHEHQQELERVLGSGGWRSCLLGSGAQWNELLGLPHTLRSIAKILEPWTPGTPIPKFSSPSDLFFQTGEEMLRRELRKRFGEQVEIANRRHSINPCCYLLECALGAVAFEMATRNHWRYVPGSGRSLAAEIEAVLKCAKERFVRSKVAFQEIEPSQVWTWAVDIIDHFMSYGGALGAQKGDRVLSFTTRRIQEMRAALFMTQYAAPQELRNENDWLSSARGHSGDTNWKELWLAAIWMPIEDDSVGSKGVDVQQYAKVMEILYERPYIWRQSDNPNAPRAQRRPTELMWECDRWIKQLIPLGFKSLISDFGQNQRSPNDFEITSKRLDEHLRNHLGNQFAEILRGTDRSSEVARDLIDLNNFVIMADPAKRIDEYDTGWFEMGGRQWDDTMLDKVPVELSKFGMCKYTLSNEQYRLFDDNFLETEQTWLFEIEYRSKFAPSEGNGPEDDLKAWHARLEDFKAPVQPAVFVSWYDSYWYAEFVNRGLDGTSLDRADWKVLLPTEAQWEYGARAGGQGDYFRGEEGGAVTAESLGRYAHFDQPLDFGKPLSVRDHGKKPNAWKLEMILGNTFQWGYDGYQDGLQGGKDPVEHNDDYGDLGRLRVIRGGCWIYVATLCRSAFRGRDVPTFRCPDFSLRLALSSSGVYGLVQEEKK